MNRYSGKKGNIFFILVMGALLFLQMLTLLYFGGKKAGFHEDELYTYYSTNKTAGLFVNDGQWMERDQIRNDFVVLPGEGFRYNVVKQMQSWDVHPPVYYYLFHTVCSLFPGVFSKWLGIGVNMAAYAVCFVLLAWVAYMAATLDGAAARENEERRRMGKMLAFLTCLGWGGSCAVISGVMFIRMYQWLTLFILLCLGLHLGAMERFCSGRSSGAGDRAKSEGALSCKRRRNRSDFDILRFGLPLSVTVFLGFLTQYYYLIFHFFLGLGFCFLLLKYKKIKEIFLYGLFCGVGFAGAVLYYPASLSHIFRGYRGTEAVSEFSNMSNTWERLRFFYGLFDDYVMNGTLSWWLLGICLLAVTAGYSRKKTGGLGRKNAAVCLIFFTCAGYFFTVSKTALVLGETSNRYQLPIYGLMVFLILYGVWTLLFIDSRAGLLSKRMNDIKPVAALLICIALVMMNQMALRSGKVFFLYEEEKEVMDFVRSHEDAVVAVLYNEASPDHIWWLADELMVYDKVYLASLDNPEPILDQEMIESEKILVYAADYENFDECVRRLLKGGQWSDCRLIAKKGLWTLYEFSR